MLETRLSASLAADPNEVGKYFNFVLYQDQLGFIKEATYHSDIGWFVGPDDVVTSSAKRKSALAVISWVDGVNIELRAYFIDRDNKIGECSSTIHGLRDRTPWVPVESDFGAAKAAVETQLTALRSSNGTLRLVYQSDNGALHQLFQAKNSKRWADSSITSTPVYHGTGLALVTGSNDFRLYYTNTERKIERLVYEPNLGWGHQMVLPVDLVVHFDSAIAATAWRSSDSHDLQIRLHTLDDMHNLVRVYYDQAEEEWRFGTDKAGEETPHGSGIAAVPTTDRPGDLVFYQPQWDPRTIAKFEYHGEEKRRVPLGIATSQGRSGSDIHGVGIDEKERLRYGDLLRDVFNALQSDGSVDDLKSRVDALLARLAVPDEKVAEIAHHIDGWLGNGARKPHVTVIPPTDKPNLTLINAAADGDLLAVQGLLLDPSYDIHLKDNNGHKAIWHAAQQGRTDILKLLAARTGVSPSWVERLANDHSSHGLKQIMFEALHPGDEKVVQAVLDLGGSADWTSGDVNIAWSSWNAPALHYANYYQWQHIFRLLVSYGANKGALDGYQKRYDNSSWGGAKGY
ncbi:unnamed protein product [Clonostachys rosea]|uniref:Fucose-specific lectin n=1 Tax=Bionectria ochroleuca TaxID=29856 RepID=A0ABY6U9R7_BIOOC|nr:unnamed protein product [Clonostachys rosea]